MTESTADEIERMAHSLNKKDFKVFDVQAGDSESTIEARYKEYEFEMVIKQWGKASFECYLYVDPNDYKRGVTVENSYMSKSVKMCFKDLPGHLEDMI